MKMASSAAGKTATRQGKEGGLVLTTLRTLGRSWVEWKARREPVQSISERDRRARLIQDDTPANLRRGSFLVVSGVGVQLDSGLSPIVQSALDYWIPGCRGPDAGGWTQLSKV